MSILGRRDTAPNPEPEATVDSLSFARRPPDCDRCPAVACVLVASPTVARRPNRTPWRPYLTLCGHHYRSHGAVLSLRGWRVEVDLRGDLVAAEDARFRDPRPGHPRSDGLR